MKIEDLAPIAILLLVTGIVLGIGADVLTNIGDEIATFDAQFVGDEGVHLNSTTAYILAERADRGGGYANLTLKNQSGGDFVHADNYTFDDSAGTVILVSGSSFNNTVCNVTYSYGAFGNVGVVAAENATKGIGEMASWFPTIALVLAAAVIIGMVVFYFRPK